MRRSFGGAGRGMGGGGKMINFRRAVVGGATPNATGNIGAAKTKNFTKKHSASPPSTCPNTALTLYPSSSSSSPFPSLVNFPISAASAPAWAEASSSTVCSDESEWEYVDGIDDDTTARGFYDDCVFGTVPSLDEVHHVVSALQQAKLSEIRNQDVDEKTISRSSSDQMDWLEPSLNIYSSQMLQRPTSGVVYDAFHLLETEPSVQRMVVSLSSDRAVWDAVMNNDVVKELRGTIDRVSNDGEGEVSKGTDQDDNILGWIITFAKTKMMQLLDLITKVANNVFDDNRGGGGEGEGEGDDVDNGFDGRVKSSFFLSVVVLLVVIFARSQSSNGLFKIRRLYSFHC